MMLLKIKGCIPNNKTRLLTIKEREIQATNASTEPFFSSRGLERVIVLEVPGAQPAKLSPHLRLFFKQNLWKAEWSYS